ncbi:MAG: hypothetical protein V4480_03130 [Patescibacteria group bacterium]
MKSIRIILLVLILIGLGLLAAQSIWVPPLVNWILAEENTTYVVEPAPMNIVPPPATTMRPTPSKPPAPGVQETGTLLGTVSLSPTCPVERIPPDPQCAPKPYVTSVTVLRTGGTSIVAQQKTEDDGSFRFSLAPGLYTVKAAGAAVYPRCSSASTQVTKDTITSIAISCDTGIR